MSKVRKKKKLEVKPFISEEDMKRGERSRKNQQNAVFQIIVFLLIYTIVSLMLGVVPE